MEIHAGERQRRVGETHDSSKTKSGKNKKRPPRKDENIVVAVVVVVVILVDDAFPGNECEKSKQQRGDEQHDDGGSEGSCARKMRHQSTEEKLVDKGKSKQHQKTRAAQTSLQKQRRSLI